MAYELQHIWRTVKARKRQQRKMRKLTAAREWDAKMRLRMDRHSANRIAGR